MARRSLLSRLFRIGHAEPEPALEAVGEAGTLTDAEDGEETKGTETHFERATDAVPTGTATESTPEAGSSRLPPEEMEMEAKPPVVTGKPLSKREETAQKLTEGFDNLSNLLENVNTNLEAAGDRSERMANELEGLPEVLKQIPETNRAQIEFLGAISRQLDVQNGRNTELAESLKSLPDLLQIIPEGNRHQAEKLGQISDHLSESSRDQAAQFRAVQKAQDATFVALRNSQNKSITLVNKSQQAALTVFKQSQASQARQIQSLIDRTQKSMNKTILMAAAMMGAAIIGAVVLTLIL